MPQPRAHNFFARTKNKIQTVRKNVKALKATVKDLKKNRPKNEGTAGSIALLLLGIVLFIGAIGLGALTFLSLLSTATGLSLLLLGLTILVGILGLALISRGIRGLLGETGS